MSTSVQTTCDRCERQVDGEPRRSGWMLGSVYSGSRVRLVHLCPDCARRALSREAVAS